MTPGARIQAAIELLDRIEAPKKGEEALPADAVLNAHFRARRYIGAKDRRAIADAVFQTLRQRGTIDWLLRTQTGLPAANRFRALWTFAVHQGIATGELAAACNGARHHPAPLSEDEARRVRMIDMQTGVPPALADLTSTAANNLGQTAGPFMARVPDLPATTWTGAGTTYFYAIDTANGTFTISASGDGVSVVVP